MLEDFAPRLAHLGDQFDSRGRFLQISGVLLEGLDAVGLFVFGCCGNPQGRKLGQTGRGDRRPEAAPPFPAERVP